MSKYLLSVSEQRKEALHRKWNPDTIPAFGNDHHHLFFFCRSQLLLLHHFSTDRNWNCCWWMSKQKWDITIRLHTKRMMVSYFYLYVSPVVPCGPICKLSIRAQPSSPIEETSQKMLGMPQEILQQG